jgi:uncharacterized protein YwgA/O-acetyl-ADP-ribose deacetylase (regulator of RNase III)
MVTVKVGELFDSKAQTLINTVNTVGIMGKGIALGFKKRFPDMYEDYLQRCRAGQLRLGQPYLYRRPVLPWILNFPTKGHWRSVSRLSDIQQGLEYLEKHHREWGITSLAVPPLGCGQGQLEWRVVGPVLLQALNRLSIPVELYAPHGTPDEQLELSFLQGTAGSAGGASSSLPYRIEPAWVALVEILARIERERFHPPVGRITFQKLAYFATATGIPTNLEYVRSSYGPYAAQLKSVISRLVNNGLLREEPRGQMLEVRVGPAFAAARDAYRQNLESWNDSIENVADLLMRMNTRQAEVAATVHFAAELLRRTLGRVPSEAEVLGEVMKWKEKRRPPLSDAEIALTIRALSMLGRLRVTPSEELTVDEEQLVGA